MTISSPEVLKSIKNDMIKIENNLTYYRDLKEVQSDQFIMQRFALIAALANAVNKHIHE